jgi:hypothetical protein
MSEREIQKYLQNLTCLMSHVKAQTCFKFSVREDTKTAGRLEQKKEVKERNTKNAF